MTNHPNRSKWFSLERTGDAVQIMRGDARVGVLRWRIFEPRQYVKGTTRFHGEWVIERHGDVPLPSRLVEGATFASLADAFRELCGEADTARIENIRRNIRIQSALHVI